MSSQDELARLRATDPAAWEALWKRNAERMMKIAARRLRVHPKQAAEALEEICQRVIVKFYRRISSVEITTSIDEYLGQHVYNECSKWQKGWEDRHQHLGTGMHPPASRGVSTIIGSREDRKRWQKSILKTIEAVRQGVREQIRKPRASFRQAPLLHWAVMDGCTAGAGALANYGRAFGVDDNSQLTRLRQAAAQRLAAELEVTTPAVPERLIRTPERLLTSDLFALAWDKGDYGCPERHGFPEIMDASHARDLEALHRIHSELVGCPCLGLVIGPELEPVGRRVVERYISATLESIGH